MILNITICVYKLYGKTLKIVSVYIWKDSKIFQESTGKNQSRVRWVFSVTDKTKDNLIKTKKILVINI